jgi:hypothetical protein
MPSPQDQLADQRQADRIRPLDRNPTAAELRERLERLPPNHPSSPRYDDSTGEAPEPDPAAREFSRPQDSGSRPESATVDRELSGEDAPRIHPDGTWEWKGYTLTPAESRCADLALARCRDAEGRNADGSYGDHGLTPAMRRIEAQLEHGKLAPDTEKYALKSLDRFKEKLAKLIERYPGQDPESLTMQIHDGIRYTFLSDTDNYVLGLRELTSRLQESSYEPMFQVNNWGDDEYKGVNTRWRDPSSGLIFEVQIHTPEGLQAKEQTHDSYERINDIRTPVAEVERLRRYQMLISEQIARPPDWNSIANYHRESR